MTPPWAKVALGGVVAAFVSLVGARYLSGTPFVLSLFGIGVGLSTTLHATTARVLRWATRRPRTPALGAAAIAAGTALAGRTALRVTIGLDPEAAHRLDPVVMATAAVALTGALAGLGWSALVLGRRPAASWGAALAATAVSAACLYTLGPLLLSVGVPVSAWTLLSLAAVGVLFYAGARALSRG